MPKKDVAPEKKSPKSKPKKSKDEAAKPEDLEEPRDELDEAPVKKKKKSKRKKGTKTRGKLSVLQAAVLETIRERPQRPRAIQTIIYSTGGVDLPRNEIIRSLNELRDKGLVEKVTAKAWQAT